MLRNVSFHLLKTSICSTKQHVRYKRGWAKKIAVKKRTVNPGVNLQMKLFNDKQQKALGDADTEELESDFMNLGMSYREHVKEIETLKEKEKYLIVKQKYFKEKTPNFLTWSDKVQMRYLHNKDPEEWTVEKLSDSFPALPTTIAKIIKSSWTKKGESKIRNHDVSVEKNWQEFKNGKLELPPDLEKHLKKFTHRKLNFELVNLPGEIEKTKKRIHGEFSEIIDSYERLTNKNQEFIGQEKSDEMGVRKPQRETYTTVLPSEFKDTKRITLRGLKEKLEGKVKVGNEIDEDDRILLQKLNSSVQEIPKETENPIIDISDITKPSYLVAKSVSVKDYKHLEYPEKIIIPKDKIKHGYTYKLNDCFYDSDGLFLYRVPGMEK